MAQPAAHLVAPLLGLLLLFVSGCKAGSGEACKPSSECQAGLICFESACQTQQAADLGCRQSDRLDDCTSLGLCTASQEGKCIAGKNEDCLRSGMCDKLGFCAAIGGRCAISAEKDGDCRRPKGSLRHDHCAFAGLCSAKGGECVAATDEDCQGAVVCKQDGSCTAQDGRCTLGASTRADCDQPVGMLKHNPCKDEGRCTPKDGSCVATKDADCAAIEDCRRHGRCTAQEGRCIVGKDGDCQQSAACKELDLCVRQDLFNCAAPDCQTTRACTALGQCKLVTGRCRATQDADCGKSTGCVHGGYCHLDTGLGQCLRKPGGGGTAERSSDGAVTLVISKSALLFGEEAEPVLRLPSRDQQIRPGIAAISGGGQPGGLLILPLAERAKGAVERAEKRLLAQWREPVGATTAATVIADDETPYRVILEVVYTLGQSGIGRYHLMVMKRAGEPAADAGTRQAPTTPPPGPPLEAIRGAQTLGLTAHIGADGIVLRTSAGNIAKGCEALGPSVTVPKQQGRHDLDALAGCLQRVKAAFPGETASLLSAEHDTPYRLVIQVMDELRGHRGRELFPQTNLGFPRPSKEKP